jgi:non-ribosomal peptide synthetase component F
LESANPVRPSTGCSPADPERDRLVGKWSGIEALQTRSSICLHALFEEQVERTPEAVAVVFGGEQLAYRSLNAQSNQLARHLRQVGVRAERRIGICMERSVEMIVALLGVWKAGACFVPLDPSHPKDRLGFSIADADLDIATENGRNSRPSQRLPFRKVDENRSRLPLLICLDADWGAIHESDLNSPERHATEPGYIIYTSGSTASPKGS